MDFACEAGTHRNFRKDVIWKGFGGRGNLRFNLGCSRRLTCYSSQRTILFLSVHLHHLQSSPSLPPS